MLLTSDVTSVLSHRIRAHQVVFLGNENLPQKGNLTVRPSFLLQASSANDLIADEYMKDAKTPEEIRDAFTEIVGDLLMTLPVVMVAGHHSGQRAAIESVLLECR